ncbi:MAG TPA: TrbG/VirB9 family P-type conjugative transfer protein [Candidatus Cybelea sp.]|nr:TrbG/VirB9 family P-type conjugative transfer protein [Candidatus Cybelea sp.]
MSVRAYPLALPVIFLAAALGSAVAPAQQNGPQPVETSTPWNPEQVPAQAAFDFGAAAEPVLTCAPGKYCGLALQTGETVLTADANEDHWSVTPTTYGAGNLAKPVILVTPFAAGVSDELTIDTMTAQHKQRSYKVKLVSDAAQWTQLAVFRYPPGQ